MSATSVCGASLARRQVFLFCSTRDEWSSALRFPAAAAASIPPAVPSTARPPTRAGVENEARLSNSTASSTPGARATPRDTAPARATLPVPPIPLVTTPMFPGPSFDAAKKCAPRRASLAFSLLRNDKRQFSNPRANAASRNGGRRALGVRDRYFRVETINSRIHRLRRRNTITPKRKRTGGRERVFGAELTWHGRSACGAPNLFSARALVASW